MSNELPEASSRRRRRVHSRAVSDEETSEDLPQEGSEASLHAWLYALTAPLVIACGVGAEPWTWGFMYGLMGLVLLLAPPRVRLPRLPALLLLALALVPLSGLLPATWFGPLPEWRTFLVDAWSAKLPATRSAQPAATLEAWLTWVAGLVWLAACLGQQFTVGERRLVLRVLVSGILVLAALSLFEPYSGWCPSWWPRQSQRWGEGFGPFTNRNHSSSLFAIGAVLAAAVAYDSFRQRRRDWALFSLGLITLLVSVFVNTSRAGVLLALLGLILWVATAALRHGLFRKLAVAGAVLLVSAAVVLAARGGAGNRLRTLTELEALTSNLRLELAREGLRMVSEAPLLGLGLGNFSAIYPMVTKLHHPLYHVLHPESDVVWLLVEGGLLMMLPAVLLVFWLVAACSSRADAGRNQRSGLRLRRAAGIGLLLALLHGFVDVPNHRLAYGLVVAVLAAVAVNPSWLRVPVGPPARAGFRIAGLALLVLAAVHVSQMRGWLPELESTAELLHRRAVDASAARRHNEAYELADRAVALSPLNFRMYYLRAQLALQLRLSPDDALMDFGRARALEPGYAATCLQEGMYWLGFRPLFAVIPWRECLRRDPEYAVGPHGNYQMMLNQMGRHPELLDPLWQLADRLELQVLFLNASPGGELWQERLEEVLAQNPRLELADKALLKTLFDAWGARGDRARLVALLTEHPEWLPYGWRHLAEERARAGRFREAFELASTQVPPPPRATSLLASDVPRLERVVLMNPNDPRPAVELYHALCAAGDDKQALRVLEKVARLPNAPPFLPLELAQAHARLGDYERAWQVVTEYLAKAS
jgi:hypothetical protein